MGGEALGARVDALSERGVIVVDPRQTYVDETVDLNRVHAGAVLHPGTRLVGARVLVGPGARVGTEGPATLVDAALGADASVASGHLHGAVLLYGASAGAQSHFRPGTLLEEQASTAHCVGLKHTLLLSFVTLGSLINFCDCLMAGGTSRKDHSEVGSGFIHFNFTPWGARGDKATPSLIGDVVHGVFLREPRIFLGGSGGMVGPRAVGYGAVAGAGQVIRADVERGSLAIQTLRAVKRTVRRGYLDAVEPRAGRNVAYIGQLVALRCWYASIRGPRAAAGPDALWRVPLIEQAVALLDEALAERVKRLDAFLGERGASLASFGGSEIAALGASLPCPDALTDAARRDPSLDHVAWVRSLDDATVSAGHTWLRSIVDAASERLAIERG